MRLAERRSITPKRGVARIKRLKYFFTLAAFCGVSYAQSTMASLKIDIPSASQSGPTAERSPDDQEMLEEVIITAQKRPERLEDIPVAAQVVSSQALAAANVADLSDLNNLVPSVQLNGTINGRVPTGIRGISSVSSEGTVGISSGVAVMIDGVPGAFGLLRCQQRHGYSEH